MPLRPDPRVTEARLESWTPVPRHRPLPLGDLRTLLGKRLARGITRARCFAHAAPALMFRGVRLTRAPFLHVMLAGRMRVVSPNGDEQSACPGDGLFFAKDSYVNVVFPGACRFFRATITPAGTFFGEVEILGPGAGGPGDEPVLKDGTMRACVLPGAPGPTVDALTGVLTRLTSRAAHPDDIPRAAAVFTALLYEWQEALAAADEHLGEGLPNSLSLRARQFMEEHAHRPINSETVATALGVSAEHLARVLRRDTGKGPLEHLHTLRQAHALELLADHTLPIEEIAARCGFTSRSYFTQFFTRRIGQSPRAYRTSRE